MGWRESERYWVIGQSGNRVIGELGNLAVRLAAPYNGGDEVTLSWIGAYG
jgi:hypothetical protein